MAIGKDNPIDLPRSRPTTASQASTAARTPAARSSARKPATAEPAAAAAPSAAVEATANGGTEAAAAQPSDAARAVDSAQPPGGPNLATVRSTAAKAGRGQPSKGTKGSEEPVEETLAVRKAKAALEKALAADAEPEAMLESGNQSSPVLHHF